MSKYPRVGAVKRKPDKNRDGEANYGKPCIFCGKGTKGEKWVEYGYMRGTDDVPVRVCHEHWKGPGSLVIEALEKAHG